MTDKLVDLRRKLEAATTGSDLDTVTIALSLLRLMMIARQRETMPEALTLADELNAHDREVLRRDRDGLRSNVLVRERGQ